LVSLEKRKVCMKIYELDWQFMPKRSNVPVGDNKGGLSTAKTIECSMAGTTNAECAGPNK
jgi:hypothetical protein